MVGDKLPLEGVVEENYSSQSYRSIYSGASGLIMRASHRLMEIGIAPEQNANVLDVGGGGMPHLNWLKVPPGRMIYTLSDRLAHHQSMIAEVQDRLRPEVTLRLHDFAADPELAEIGSGFTRIVASHVLEHIPDPERAIRKWLSLLVPEGVLSIAIPCDPGWLWRLGQKMRFGEKRMKLSFEEYDLLMSREHVNSAQRIMKIINYYFTRADVKWFPSFVPVVDFNLLCIISAEKRHLRSRG